MLYFASNRRHATESLEISGFFVQQAYAPRVDQGAVHDAVADLGFW